MAAPTILKVYPEDGDTNIPVGEQLLIYFDRGVDKETVESSVVLFGRDYDTTSGPDSAIWIDERTKEQRYFLKSPGFNGYVPLKFEFSYWDTTSVTYDKVESPVEITSEADEIVNNYGQLVTVIVDPNFSATLAPDSTYTFYINGDPDNTNSGISSKTIFDVIADPGNTGAGITYVDGSFNTTTADILNIKIIFAGNIGTAKYKYWWDSEGFSTAKTMITSRKWRTLSKGLQVRFAGNSFVVNDLWTINCKPIERMATSTKIIFTTNDGSYSEAPATSSTPASSSPPASVLPSNIEPFEVSFMVPENASYNIDRHNRTITITFSEDIDPTTITDESIVLWKYPVEGYYDSTWKPTKLAKTLSVTDNVLTIVF